MTSPEGTAGNNRNWCPNLNDIINLGTRFIAEYEKRSQTSPPAHNTTEGLDTVGRDRLILEELRKDYDREIDLRKHTEGKANTIITFSGVILTLLLAFIALYFDKITFENEYQWLIRGLLLAVISAIVLSLILSILSVKAGRNLDTASTIGIFVTDDGHVNWPGIINWRDSIGESDMDILKKYIDIYTDATGKNRRQREKKAMYLLRSQISLMVGIGLIGGVIGLTIFFGF